MRKTIAVDFDGCLCKEDWPEIGAPNLEVINAVIKERQHGSAIILWTCREGEKLDEAVRFCKSYGLEFDAVNENLPERTKLYGNDCRKIGADEYWDDRAVHMPAIRAQKEEESRASTCKTYRTCNVCTKTDGLIYNSSPPMARCTVDGKYHAPDSECTLNLDNEPLTLDELWEMAQKCEGVYVAYVDGTPAFREQKYCAAVLDISPAFGSSTLHIHAIYGDRLTLWEDDYGKTWLAYRHRPKEGTR